MLNPFSSLGLLRRRFRPYRCTALALLYHRVTEVPLDPQCLCVSPQHFGDHLEVLTRQFHPLGLREFTDRLICGRLPTRAVILTFDDGYADNLWNAKPILKRYGVPASVFVTTGALGADREFWWDELEGLLLQPGVLPEVIHLRINNVHYRWELGSASRYTADDYVRYTHWNVLQPDAPTPRHDLYRSLCKLVRPLVEWERRRVINELVTATGRQPGSRTSHRALSPPEVIELARDGLVDVGAHTVSHPQLAALPIHLQRAEIEQSKTHLESILARPVSTFAYPYGSRLDYTNETVTAVRAAGFTTAWSNFPEEISWKADLFELPRLIIHDADGDIFAQHLTGALNG
jgi:peptidoglycan/xylan/chitin deacetylase (PgdA/CDA1 family)